MHLEEWDETTESWKKIDIENIVGNNQEEGDENATMSMLAATSGLLLGSVIGKFAGNVARRFFK